MMRVRARRRRWLCGCASCLRKQHVEHDAVDAVVHPVDGDRPDGVVGLTEAVDAAFALFVAGGVPGEVVVHDGLEGFLQVDAFGQAVGGHQHVAAIGGGQFVDARGSFDRGQRHR